MTQERVLTVLSGSLAICRLDPQAELPPWAQRGAFRAMTRTATELSVVCPEEGVPPEVVCERGWRCLEVQGPLDLTLTGVLAALAGALAEAGVSLFAVSTYDTDYLLVRQKDLDRAAAALRAAGHTVR